MSERPGRNDRQKNGTEDKGRGDPLSHTPGTVEHQVQVLLTFLRNVFANNCRCFDTTCRIKMQDAILGVDNDLPCSIFKLLEIFRKSSNAQTCVTVFDAKSTEHCVILGRHIEAIVDTGLLRFSWIPQGSRSQVRKSIRSFLCGLRGSFVSQDMTSCTLANGQTMQWNTIKKSFDAGSLKSHNKRTCFCKPFQEEAFKSALTSITREHYTEENMHILAGVLLWYFRKAMVDHLIQLVAQRENVCLTDAPNCAKSCKAISVGSTRITSDYDITVQGDCVDKVVGSFNSYFKAIFGSESGEVFDTNLYGSSFVMNAPPRNEELFVRKNCARGPFEFQMYWVADPPSGPVAQAIVDQHHFALLKVFISAERFLHGSDTHGSMTGNHPEEGSRRDIVASLAHGLGCGISHDQYAQLPIFENRQVNGFSSPVSPRSPVSLSSPVSSTGSTAGSGSSSPSSATSGSSSGSIKRYEKFPFGAITKQSDYTDLLNLISSYNLYGNETYFTRGAFVDVVFNTQTCGPGRGIPLTDDDLLDSLLENFGDFVAHHYRDKYFKRIKSSFNAIKSWSFPWADVNVVTYLQKTLVSEMVPQGRDLTEFLATMTYLVLSMYLQLGVPSGSVIQKMNAIFVQSGLS